MSGERFQIIFGLAPFLLLVLGSMYIHNCPKEPMVPIYVIVGSLFFLLLQLLGFCGCAEMCLPFVLVVILFIFCWLIAGSVYVYGAFQPNFDSSHSPEYCERVLYEAAFWCTNLAWVTIVVLSLCGTVRACYHAFCEERLMITHEPPRPGANDGPDEEAGMEAEKEEEGETLQTDANKNEETGKGDERKRDEEQTLQSV